MRKILLCILVAVIAQTSIAQFVYKIKADSVLITRDSCTAELIIENSTKNVRGFLYNKGNGRTEFRKAERLNDSTLIVGNDTIIINGGGVTASNGLSMFGKTVQLGQSIGAVGNPAAITSNREIPFTNPDSLILRNGYFKIRSNRSTSVAPFVVHNTTPGAWEVAQFIGDVAQVEVHSNAAKNNAFASFDVFHKDTIRLHMGYNGPGDYVFMGMVTNVARAVWQTSGNNIIGGFWTGSKNFFFGDRVSDSGKVNIRKSVADQTASTRILNVTDSGSTFNTSAGALNAYGGYYKLGATRASGSNPLTNTGLYASATGAQNNYAAIFDQGNVGIGSAAPVAKLHVAGTGIYTDTLTATTMGDADSSNRVASTAFVKRQLDSLANNPAGTLASNGLSIVGGEVQLGQPMYQLGGPAAIYTDRHIPLNGISVKFDGHYNGSEVKISEHQIDLTANQDQGSVANLNIIESSTGSYLSLMRFKDYSLLNSGASNIHMNNNGNTTIRNSYLPLDLGVRLGVEGKGLFTDTLTATTMGNADSSKRVASTAFVKQQGFLKSIPTLQQVSLKRTAINNAGYTALSTDYLIAFTALTAGRTVTLPSATGMTDRIMIIKDESGAAGTHNITINVTAGGTIDGVTSKLITTNYGSIEVYSNGSQWFVK